MAVDGVKLGVHLARDGAGDECFARTRRAVEQNFCPRLDFIHRGERGVFERLDDLVADLLFYVLQPRDVRKGDGALFFGPDIGRLFFLRPGGGNPLCGSAAARFFDKIEQACGGAVVLHAHLVGGRLDGNFIGKLRGL